MRTIPLSDGATVPQLGLGTWRMGQQPARRTHELAAIGYALVEAARTSKRIAGFEGADLVTLRGRAVVDGWIGLLREGRMEELAADLMAEHYDPAYRRSRARYPAPSLLSVSAGALAEEALNWAAERIAEAAGRA